MHAAVQSVNASLRLADPRHTVSCLMASDLQLPQVFPFAAALYHQELRLLQRQSPQVQTHLSSSSPARGSKVQPHQSDQLFASNRESCSRRSYLLLWRCCLLWRSSTRRWRRDICSSSAPYWSVRPPGSLMWTPPCWPGTTSHLPDAHHLVFACFQDTES